MKLWLISQDFNTGYDTYDSAVVAAETEDDARNMNPSDYSNGCWCQPEHVDVQLLGDALQGTEKGVVLASFNAG
jgi:hypothetical protein